MKKVLENVFCCWKRAISNCFNGSVNFPLLKKGDGEIVLAVLKKGQSKNEKNEVQSFEVQNAWKMASSLAGYSLILTSSCYLFEFNR